MSDIKKHGVIYILLNPAFPHLIKIGYADDVINRLKSLNKNSGIPADFHVYATYEVFARLEDKKIHDIIDTLDPTLRYNKRREFYEMAPEKAYRILESIATINGLQDNLTVNPLNDSYVSDIMNSNPVSNNPVSNNPVDNKTIETTKKTPKPALTFDMINIKAGEELIFTEDDSIRVVVADDLKHIIYNGSKMSMSTLVRKLLSSKYNVQGTLYFTYKGKRLTDIRAEIESNNSST
jgi:hypothetical protein